jgi:hypothetical protein
VVFISLKEDLDYVFQTLDSALEDLGIFVFIDSSSLSREKVLEDCIFVVEQPC